MGDRGTLAERFELQDELGRGAMGVVFRARERATGREVALKVLHEGSADPELAARTRREAELQARLDHPGVVVVHAAGEDGDSTWVSALDVHRGLLEAEVAARAAGAPPEAWVRLAREHLALARRGETPLQHARRAAGALRRPAEGGLLEAQALLAQVHLERLELGEAARWLDALQARGDQDAASRLAELLSDGQPTPPDDLVRARALADVAAASSDEAVAARARAVQAALGER